MVDWHIVRDGPSAAAFTTEMQAAQRSYWGRTSISAGIDHAMQMLAEGGFEAQRRVIDVAGRWHQQFRPRGNGRARRRRQGPG